MSLRSVLMVDVRFELTTNDPWSCRRRHLLGDLVETQYPPAGLPIEQVLGVNHFSEPQKVGE